MKKLLVVLAVALLSSTVSGQLNYDAWNEVKTVDEFGDVTGGVMSRIFCKGVFSNSATSKSELTVKMVDNGSAISMDLFEYNRAPGAIIAYSEFGKISIKQPSGDIVEVPTFAPKSGGLYFSQKDYPKLKKALVPGSKIVVYEDEFSEYGSSKYVFSYM